MNNRDKNYLLIQFKVKVYQKNAAEFQMFFEEIMGKAFTDFRKIRPYGNEGDRGNDGYRPDKGTYYQVYSPKEPLEKEAGAAKKFKADFEKLKNNWDPIAKIKKYYFVFNDKYTGTSIELERAAAELKSSNGSIDFENFTCADLEEVFINLNSEQLLALGFDVDSRNSIRIIRELILKMEDELDQDRAKYVLKTIEDIKGIIGQVDETILLDYEIIKSRALQKDERIKEARENYQGIYKRYPNDPRAPLYLAEIYLSDDNLDKNKEFLAIAEQINPKYWLLNIEKTIRDLHLHNKIDTSNIDEKSFPQESRIKSIFYRIYSLILEDSKEFTRADSFIERAIYFNQSRFENYYTRLLYLEERAFSEINNIEVFRNLVKSLLLEIEALRQKFEVGGDLGLRNKAKLNRIKQTLFIVTENIVGVETTVKETFNLALQCYFDSAIDVIIADTIHHVELPSNDFVRLLDYLMKSEKPASYILNKMIVLQFIRKNNLLTEGKSYFEKAGNRHILKLINLIENKNYDDALTFIKDDNIFILDLAVSINIPGEFRKKLIEALPNDAEIQKEKLFLLLNYDEGNINEAFKILKKLDISNLSYVECKSVYKIAEKKRAWDYVVILSEKLLKHEKDKRIILNIKIELFIANLHLEYFPQVIRIGKDLLADSEDMKLLNETDREMLLTNTIYALMKRSEFKQAKELIETHKGVLITFSTKVSVESEVYLANHEPQNALKSVVEAVELVKRPSPEEYGSLFMLFIHIGNLMDFKLSSLNEVIPQCFIKVKGLDRWFYIGDGNELDATKITKNEETSNLFTGKKLGEIVVFRENYSSGKNEYEIENIMTREKYILWQSRHHATELTKEHRWDKMELIEVPKTELSIDTKYIQARLEDDLKKRGTFFDLYCQQNLPLAMLAVNEGGLTNAIGRIVSERKGFIRATSGAKTEIDEQREVAREIINGKPFYIDGTSAFILSETGLMPKVFELVPNIKVPQAVISLLFEIKDKFRFIPGQAGYLSYARGKLTFSSIDKNYSEISQSNFDKSIKLLESKTENIKTISLANKSDGFSEQRVHPSLSDACVLAQKENIPVLTDDFLYLKVNELDTKKKAPRYCSTFILMRVLLEQKKISFDCYIDFFYHLSTMRYRFLQISLDDLVKAIFGDKIITVVKPKQIRKFNFALTLSEEYGVKLPMALSLLKHLLVTIILDDTILPEISEQIFAEIISTFPTNKDKKALGKILIMAANKSIDDKYKRLILGSAIKKKEEGLSKFAQTWVINIPILN